MQSLAPFVGQLLPLANGLELGQVVFVARGVLPANLLLVLIELIEVFSEVTATRRLHLGCEAPDAALDRPLFLLLAGLLTVADESAALRQMVERPAEQMTVLPVAEIELLGQCHIAVVVGIAVRIVVGALPLEKSLVERIVLFFPPCGQLLPGQRRTEVVADEYPEQVDLPKAPPEVLPAQRPGVRPVLYGRLFVVLFACDTLLKDVDALLFERVSVLRLFDDGPTERVGAEVQSQYRCHVRKNPFL